MSTYHDFLFNRRKKKFAPNVPTTPSTSALVMFGIILVIGGVFWIKDQFDSHRSKSGQREAQKAIKEWCKPQNLIPKEFELVSATKVKVGRRSTETEKKLVANQAIIESLESFRGLDDEQLRQLREDMKKRKESTMNEITDSVVRLASEHVFELVEQSQHMRAIDFHAQIEKEIYALREYRDKNQLPDGTMYVFKVAFKDLKEKLISAVRENGNNKFEIEVLSEN